jgi:hypothetical protein
VQERAQNAPHIRIVIDDQEPKLVEIDADHGLGTGRHFGNLRPRRLFDCH